MSERSETASNRTPEKLARGIADYVRTHTKWSQMNKEDAAYEAAMVLLTDPTAGHDAWEILTESAGQPPAVELPTFPSEDMRLIADFLGLSTEAVYKVVAFHRWFLTDRLRLESDDNGSSGDA